MKSIHEDNELYFIAIIPPNEINEQIENFKQYIFKTYGSRGSLKAPPHITLHMPFHWKRKKQAVLKEKLLQFSESINSCIIELKDFNCFEPKVIYVDVLANQHLTSAQSQLHKFCKTKLNLFNAQYKSLPFHPHITVAFRDLKKPMFYRAWEEFKMKKFSSSFVFNKLTLLKYDEEQWLIDQEFEMNN
jgi:2'-5' RNA ligase